MTACRSQAKSDARRFDPLPHTAQSCDSPALGGADRELVLTSGADGCAAVAASLKGVDLLYKRLTVPGESGDAVVPGHSQLYPNVGSQFQFAVYDADSHVGVLKSTSTSTRIIATSIMNTFGLPAQ